MPAMVTDFVLEVFPGRFLGILLGRVFRKLDHGDAPLTSLPLLHWCDAALDLARGESGPAGTRPRAARTTGSSRHCPASQWQTGPPPRPCPNVPRHTDSRRAFAALRPQLPAAPQSDSSAVPASLPNTLCFDRSLRAPRASPCGRIWPAPPASPARTAPGRTGPGECRVSAPAGNSTPYAQRVSAPRSCCTPPQIARLLI